MLSVHPIRSGHIHYCAVGNQIERARALLPIPPLRHRHINLSQSLLPLSQALPPPPTADGWRNRSCLVKSRQRLMEERKSFRKNRPFGFFARPCTLPDGTQDLMKWECGIPGKDGTLWAGAVFPLTMTFSEDYPLRPPKCHSPKSHTSFRPSPHVCAGQFPSGFFHPNIFPSGTVCLSILNEEGDWQPGISTQQILTGIQDLLDSPNPNDPAQEPAFKCYMEDRDGYHRKIKQQTAKYSAILQ